MNKVDIHCHILPCVDDGAGGTEEALRLLKMQEEAGVTRVILTPHLRSRMFETPDDEIIRRFMQLNERKKEAGIKAELSLSREYHYDRSLSETLKEGREILMAGRVMLLEFSHDTAFEDMYHGVQILRKRKITPLIAHIERYREIQKDTDKAASLRDLGALIQVNAGSILGEEDRAGKKCAHALIKGDIVFAVGSDSHNVRDRQPNLKECEALLTKKYGAEYARKVLSDNPSKLFKPFGKES